VHEHLQVQAASPLTLEFQGDQVKSTKPTPKPATFNLIIIITSSSLLFFRVLEKSTETRSFPSPTTY